MSGVHDLNVVALSNYMIIEAQTTVLCPCHVTDSVSLNCIQKMKDSVNLST